MLVGLDTLQKILPTKAAARASESPTKAEALWLPGKIVVSLDSTRFGIASPTTSAVAPRPKGNYAPPSHSPVLCIGRVTGSVGGDSSQRFEVAQFGLYAMIGVVDRDRLADPGSPASAVISVASVVATVDMDQSGAKIMDVTVSPVAAAWSLHAHVAAISVLQAYADMLPKACNTPAAAAAKPAPHPKAPAGFALALRIPEVVLTATASTATAIRIGLGRVDASIMTTADGGIAVKIPISTGSFSVAGRDILGLEGMTLSSIDSELSGAAWSNFTGSSAGLAPAQSSALTAL